MRGRRRRLLARGDAPDPAPPAPRHRVVVRTSPVREIVPALVAAARGAAEEAGRHRATQRCPGRMPCSRAPTCASTARTSEIRTCVPTSPPPRPRSRGPRVVTIPARGREPPPRGTSSRPRRGVLPVAGRSGQSPRASGHRRGSTAHEGCGRRPRARAAVPRDQSHRCRWTLTARPGDLDPQGMKSVTRTVEVWAAPPSSAWSRDCHVGVGQVG